MATDLMDLCTRCIAAKQVISNIGLFEIEPKKKKKKIGGEKHLM